MIVAENENDTQKLLGRLRTTPVSEWLDLAKRKAYSQFQFDEYAESRTIRFSKPFLPYISLNFKNVIFHLGYGKISTEGIYEFQDFFKYCMHETFKEHPVVKAIQIYITG